MEERETIRKTDPSGLRIAPLSEAIAHRIQERRRSLGLSQEEFARRLEVTRQTVSNWECARTIPDAVALGRIAHVCGITADELLGTEATAIQENAHAVRREFATVMGIVLVLQFVTMFLNSIYLGRPAPEILDSFAAFRLGVLLIGGLWIYRIARREGLATIRQMVDFASLASAHPGSVSDRLLRFIGRWFWTLWFVLAAAMCALGITIGIMQGGEDATGFIAPAFMLLIAAIPYTWEKNADR